MKNGRKQGDPRRAIMKKGTKYDTDRRIPRIGDRPKPPAVNRGTSAAAGHRLSANQHVESKA